MKSLLFATAGIPVCAKSLKTEDAIPVVSELGLDAMELEFVHSVLPEDKTPGVRAAAEGSGVALTAHGQYYMNLNSREPGKIEATKKRIFLAAKRAAQCGAWSVCFHAAFYMGRPKDEVYEKVRQGLEEVVAELEQDGVDVWVRPELTGKPTQWGDLDELLRISSELESVAPCIDFSHLHARTNGEWNSYEEFSEILQRISGELGPKALKNMHMHVSGIAYGEKGEKNHLTLGESDFRYEDLLRALKDHKIGGVLVCESPAIEKDALLLKKTYKDL